MGEQGDPNRPLHAGEQWAIWTHASCEGCSKAVPMSTNNHCVGVPPLRSYDPTTSHLANHTLAMASCVPPSHDPHPPPSHDPHPPPSLDPHLPLPFTHAGHRLLPQPWAADEHQQPDPVCRGVLRPHRPRGRWVPGWLPHISDMEEGGGGLSSALVRAGQVRSGDSGGHPAGEVCAIPAIQSSFNNNI